MSELPEGWAEAAIADVAEVNPGHPKDLEDDLTVSFVPMPALSEISSKLDTEQERPFGTVRTGYTHFAEGDVLFAKITPCMENGKAAVASGLRNGLGCGSTELHVLRPRDGMSAQYLYHFVHQESFRREAAANFTGTAGQLRVPVDFIRNALIPLAPKKEQRRIVRKLALLIEKMRSSEERLDEIPTILKRFRQSVLAAACSGRLTADWRRTNRVPLASWKELPASEACTSVDCGSTPDKARFQSRPGVPFLKVYNVVNQRIDFEYRPQYVSQETHSKQLKRSIVKPNDVLMNIVGPPLGKVAIVPAKYNEWNINQALVKFRAGPELDYWFLYYLLCSGVPYREVLEETRGSAGQSNISLSQCRNMIFSVPTLQEQQEIISQIQMMFALADRIQTRYENAKLQVDKLTQSVLAKAFRGELVPTEAEIARREGRSFETADQLLERIHRERATPAKSVSTTRAARARG